MERCLASCPGSCAGTSLREVDEAAARPLDSKVSNSGGTRGDADRHVETEPCLGALGGSTKDSYGSLGPEAVDEPVVLGPGGFEVASEGGRELEIAHGHSTFLARTTWV